MDLVKQSVKSNVHTNRCVRIDIGALRNVENKIHKPLGCFSVAKLVLSLLPSEGVGIRIGLSHPPVGSLLRILHIRAADFSFLIS